MEFAGKHAARWMERKKVKNSPILGGLFREGNKNENIKNCTTVGQFHYMQFICYLIFWYLGKRRIMQTTRSGMFTRINICQCKKLPFLSIQLNYDQFCRYLSLIAECARCTPTFYALRYSVELLMETSFSRGSWWLAQN